MFVYKLSLVSIW